MLRCHTFRRSHQQRSSPAPAAAPQHPVPTPNPHFLVPDDLLRADTERMRRDARPLSRPLVILAGYRSPRISAWSLERLLRPVIGGADAPILSVAYPERGSIPGAARIVLERVVGRFGHTPPELDVVAISMGGLVARAMQAGLIEGLPPLRTARLFTLATPHRGARLANLIAPDAAARDMRPGSAFLRRLDDALSERPIDLTCYALLRDWWVGTENTAPPGRDPHWLDPHTPFAKAMAHFAVTQDPRLALDLARRLRGEEPLAQRATPPPRRREPRPAPAPTRQPTR